MVRLDTGSNLEFRDSHVVQNRPAYLAASIDADGEKHVLGIWLARTRPAPRPPGKAPGSGAA
jgi:transposase-like protein